MAKVNIRLATVRHQDARSPNKMIIEHDCFSMASILEMFSVAERAEKWNAVIEKVRAGNLADALRSCEELGRIQIKLETSSKRVRSLACENSMSSDKKASER